MTSRDTRANPRQPQMTSRDTQANPRQFRLTSEGGRYGIEVGEVDGDSDVTLLVVEQATSEQLAWYGSVFSEVSWRVLGGFLEFLDVDVEAGVVELMSRRQRPYIRNYNGQTPISCCSVGR